MNRCISQKKKRVSLTQTCSNRLYCHGCDHAVRLSSTSICFLFCLRQKCCSGQTKLLRFILCTQRRRRLHHAAPCSRYVSAGLVRCRQAAGSRTPVHPATRSRWSTWRLLPQGETLSAEPQLRSQCKS